MSPGASRCRPEQADAGLTGKVFEALKTGCAELQVVRSTLAEAQENMTKAPGTTDPLQWSRCNQVSPDLHGKSLSYGRQCSFA